MDNEIEQNNLEYKSDNECVDEDISEKKNNKTTNNKRVNKPVKQHSAKQLETFKKLKEKRKAKWQEVKKLDMKEEIEEQLITKLNNSLENNIIPRELPPAEIKPIQYLPVEPKPRQILSIPEAKVIKPNSPYINQDLTYSSYFLNVEKNTMKNKKKIRTDYTIPTYDSSVYR